MAGRFAVPREAEYGSNGEPLAGAQLFFYETGTTKPNDTFSDDALTVANTNPVIADSAGRFGDIFLKNEDYKVILQTSAGVTVYTADPVRAPAATTKEVTSISTTTVVAASDDGKLFVADATSAAFTVTLPAVAAAANGFEVAIGKIDASLNAVTVDADGLETINGTSDFTLPGQWDFATFRTDGTQWYAHVIPQTPENTPLPEGYKTGLRLAIDSGDTEHDISVSAGSARDNTNTSNMILASALVKRIDAAWAAGTGNGGMDTGSVAPDTVYYVWAIQRTDTGAVDALFSLSNTTPTMPASYDKRLLLGSVGTDASSNLSGQLAQVLSGGGEAFESAPLTITAAGTLTVTHGMSREPTSLEYWLVNVTDAFGYVTGDKVNLSHYQEGPSTTQNKGVSVIPSATELTLKYGSEASTFSVIRQDNGARAGIGNTFWNLIVRARVD